MEIKLLEHEISHLIKEAPFYHVLKFGYGNGVLTTTDDSWEHKELMQLRKEQAVEAEADCEDEDDRDDDWFNEWDRDTHGAS